MKAHSILFKKNAEGQSFSTIRLSWRPCGWKPGEPGVLEEPIRDGPPNPVHQSQDVEEGEVAPSEW